MAKAETPPPAVRLHRAFWGPFVAHRRGSRAPHRASARRTHRSTTPIETRASAAVQRHEKGEGESANRRQSARVPGCGVPRAARPCTAAPCAARRSPLPPRRIALSILRGGPLLLPVSPEEAARVPPTHALSEAVRGDAASVGCFLRRENSDGHLAHTLFLWLLASRGAALPSNATSLLDLQGLRRMLRQKSARNKAC